MAVTHHPDRFDNAAPRLRPQRFLFAAAITSMLLAVFTAVELLLYFEAVAVLGGLLRMTCAVLWICYVIVRVLDPDSAAFCTGYVAGVRAVRADEDGFTRRR